MSNEKISAAAEFLERSLCQQNRDPRTVALRHICVEAVDIAKGCENCVDLKVPVAAATLCRALFERFIYAKWIAEAEENAVRYTETALEEGARQLRKMVERGVAKVIRKSSGEDCTAPFRKSDTKQLRRPPGFEEMARVAGIEDIYVKIYGIMSMRAHGTTFNMPAEEDRLIYVVSHAMPALLSSLVAVCEAWYTRKRTLTRADLVEYLKI